MKRLYRFIVEGAVARSVTVDLIASAADDVISGLTSQGNSSGRVTRPLAVPGNSYFEGLLRRLGWTWGEKFPAWKGVTRRIQIRERNLPGFCAGRPIEAVEALHKAFGGEFWVKDKLCYKDHKLIWQPFELKNGEWQFRE